MGAGRPKGSTGINKSSVIREYITSNPEASTNEVVDALGKKGIDVSQALVAGVRARINGGPGNKKRKIAKGEVTIKELNSVHSVVEHFEDVSDAKSMIQLICDLVEEVGSVERLNETLKAYETWKPSESDSAVAEAAEESEVVEESSSDDDEDDSDSDDEDEDEDDDD
jgi:hypothetical protein